MSLLQTEAWLLADHYPEVTLITERPPTVLYMPLPREVPNSSPQTTSQMKTHTVCRIIDMMKWNFCLKLIPRPSSCPVREGGNYTKIKTIRGRSHGTHPRIYPTHCCKRILCLLNISSWFRNDWLQEQITDSPMRQTTVLQKAWTGNWRGSWIFASIWHYCQSRQSPLKA